MENKKQLLLLVFAVAAGIVAVVLTSSYVNKAIQDQAVQLKEESDARQKELVSAMQKQNAQALAALAQEIQKVKAEQAATTQKQIAELQARIQAQQASASTAKVVKRAKPSLALRTPAGKRAVTIMINSLEAVGGLLNPGDIVDVIARLNVPTKSENAPPEPAVAGAAKVPENKPVTAMIFQGLEVLAVNTNLEETGAYYDEQQNAALLKVTVAVDPEEAGLLYFAGNNGKVELALRSPQDNDRQMVKASTWKTLADYVLQNQGADLSLPEEPKPEPVKEPEPEVKPEPVKQEPPKPNIQIFRGGKEL